MKNKFLTNFAVVIIVAASLASCSKTVIDKEVYVDSYINSIYNRAGVPVYSTMHTAYSFSNLSSVSVKGASSAAISLIDYSNQGFSFYTPVGDSLAYKTTIPSPDSFTFTATYGSGESVTKVNSTLAKSLMPAQQLTASKTTTEVVLSWKAVANTEAYKVRIFSQDPNTQTKIQIYESEYLVPKDATSDLSLPFSLVNLSQYLYTNLVFDVSAFIFEQNNDTFHAVSTATIIKNFGV